jgi:glycosyltransferase involved in cell wall biosynthesis
MASTTNFYLDESEKTSIIVYAGNIGEGQGLEKIIPSSAKLLGERYKFLIIGDGGTKHKLSEEIQKQEIRNIELKNPVNREELKKIYGNADFLFLHLNNYKAFEKVLPSKIFELAAYDKPIIAGVSGYAYQFIKQNITNVVLFNPCDVDSFVDQLKNFHYKTEVRSEFIDRFRRSKINKNMAQSIIKLIL